MTRDIRETPLALYRHTLTVGITLLAEHASLDGTGCPSLGGMREALGSAKREPNFCEGEY